MSITIQLPPDLEGRIGAIPDLHQRVVEFLRDQAELEEWRKRRYSEKAHRIVDEAMAEADRLREQRVSRGQLFRELREAREAIGQHH